MTPIANQDLYNSIVLLAAEGTAKEDRPLGDRSKKSE
jgi:hypothetical protein